MDMKNAFSIAILCLLFLVNACEAHPGGQDDNGGHTNSKTGEYHCHKPDCVLPDELSSQLTDSQEADNPLLSTTKASNIASSWGTAKKWAKKDIYRNRNTTFYCNCVYSAEKNRDGVDLKSCLYDASGAKNQSRADDLEWEHVVPASLMTARGFACWNQGLPACKKGGRHCCEKHDPIAKAMIFDLHNMVPSVGQVNALRSDKRYGLIEGETLKLACDFEWQGDIAEPPLLKRGEVARIWLYMHSQHGLVLQEGELEMFLSWSQADPPEAWEVTRNERIKAKQGNGNPYVEAFYEQMDLEQILTGR